MKRLIASAVLIVGCSGAGGLAAPEPEEVNEAPTDTPPKTAEDASTAPVDVVVDAGAPDTAKAKDASPDVVAVVDAAPDAPIVVDSGPPDAAVDAAPPPPPPPDAGAGPCVDYVVPPASPSWRGTAHYTLSSTTTQSVPFQCPTSVEGNSCRYALLYYSTSTPSGPVVYPYPRSACHIQVPAKCLPCTGGATQW